MTLVLIFYCLRFVSAVGLKVPRYHLFGDSVTVASLMESSGVADRIQVSQPIHDLLCNSSSYCLIPRTDPDLDGKRKGMRTWFLHSAAQMQHNKQDDEAGVSPEVSALCARVEASIQAERSVTASHTHQIPQSGRSSRRTSQQEGKLQVPAASASPSISAIPFSSALMSAFNAIPTQLDEEEDELQHATNQITLHLQPTGKNTTNANNTNDSTNEEKVIIHQPNKEVTASKS